MWFLKPNIEKLEAKGDVQGLIRALEHKNDNVRIAAAEALGRIRDPGAVEPLCKALTDNISDVRIAAIRALGKIGDPGAVIPLSEALKNFDSSERVSTAFTLGECYDAEYVPPVPGTIDFGEIHNTNVVESLCELIEDREPMVYFAAATVFCRIGDHRAAKPLADFLKRGIEEQRKWFAEELQKIGLPDDPAVQVWYFLAINDRAQAVRLGSSAVIPLCEALTQCDISVNVTAAEVLGDIGDARAVKPLREVLTRYEEKVGKAYKDAKDEYYKSGMWDIWSSKEGAILKEALSCSDQIARTSVEALWKIGNSEAMDALCDILINSGSGDVSAETLGDIGDARAVELLCKALNQDSEGVSTAAVRALRKIGTSKAVDALCEALTHECKATCKTAVVALGDIGSARAVEPLRKVLTHDDEEMRIAAVAALGGIGKSKALDILCEVLRDSEQIFRKAAAEAIKSHRGSTRIRADAWFIVADENWDQTVTLGESAVEALINAVEVENARKALVRIGNPAVQPICTALMNPTANAGDEKTLRATADTLASLYRTGSLNDQAKQAILAIEKTICDTLYTPHTDRNWVDTTCGAVDRHTDISARKFHL